MNDYTKEARKIMGSLGFSNLTSNRDAVDKAHTACLLAETRFDGKKGSLGNIKFSYVRNACLSHLRTVRGEKYRFHNSMYQIIRPHSWEGEYNGQADNNKDIPFKEIKSTKNEIDTDEVIQFIKNHNSFSKKEKNMLFDRYLHEMSNNEVAAKYGLSKGRTSDILGKMLKEIRESIKDM